MISITKICPEILDSEYQEDLQTIGRDDLIFNTTKILSTIELEQLSSDEVQEIKRRVDTFRVYVQRK